MRRLQLTTITLSLGIGIGLAGGADAHTPKEGDVWATLGGFAYRTKTPASGGEKVDFGGGIAAEGDVDYNGGVEIAMLYLDKKYVRTDADAVVVERIKRMYITTGYRHWLVPAFSAGAAIFSSYSMGDPKVVRWESGQSGEPPELHTSARKITEYGLDLSLQWELWSAGGFGVVADARYSFAMSRLQGEDADVYGLLLGLKYLVPKRGP
jgi:hypothetical protein